MTAEKSLKTMILSALRSTFGRAEKREPEPVDVAIGVRTGHAVVMRDGVPVMTLPADAVVTMGKAIDDQRAAVRARTARKPSRKAAVIAPPADFPDTVFIGDLRPDAFPVLSDRVER